MDVDEVIVEVEAVPVKQEVVQETAIKDHKLTVETAPYIHPMIGMNDVSPMIFWKSKVCTRLDSR